MGKPEKEQKTKAAIKINYSLSTSAVFFIHS